MRQLANSRNSRHGDTFVEVCFALAIFSFLAVIAISSMNKNLVSVQSTLESEVTRSEIDAQTEAIRFIHEAYVGSLSSGYINNTWTNITENALKPSEASNLDKMWPPQTCGDIYDSSKNPYKSKMMIINTRALSEDDGNSVVSAGNSNEIFTEAVIIPRLIYNNQDDTALNSLTTDPDADLLSKSEGIWFYAVDGGDFYDIYLQSCWYATESPTPRTVDTVFSLYNPPQPVSSVNHHNNLNHETRQAC